MIILWNISLMLLQNSRQLPKNFDVITKDDFSWLIGNAASAGFEGFLLDGTP